jgi:hypothetical protein
MQAMPSYVFLDSKDLINLVRRGRPLTLDDSLEWFDTNGVTLLLSHTTVSEFVPVHDPDRLRVRAELQQLERFPLAYVRLGDLQTRELSVALGCFRRGKDYEPIDVVYKEFWRTFWPLEPKNGEETVLTRQLERIVGFRLDEQVRMLWSRPSNFINLPEHTDRLTRIMTRLRAENPSAQTFFIEQLLETLESGSITISREEVGAFAKWLWEGPERAPGWQLWVGVLEAWRMNTGDAPKAGDINDLTHTLAIPYVQAATLDKRMAAYARQAADRLHGSNARVDYGPRIYTSLQQFLRASGLESA